MNNQGLRQALLNLPANAQEPTVDSIFVPELLNALGFEPTECAPQYKTANGTDAVDYTLRKNSDNDIFVQTKSNPYILIELKGRDINLSEGTAQYQSTVKQINRYLISDNCQTAQWGIITNSDRIQLFRKHGKVIYPATSCLSITPDNLVEIVKKIKHKIENAPKALTIAIYNNKGGVGKTTTTVNLAAALTLHGKKTLIVDFDPNQQDLTKSLEIKQGKETFSSWLEDKKNTVNPSNIIQPFVLKNKMVDRSFQIDVIPADGRLAEMSESDLRKSFKIYRLRRILESLSSLYDYILIDSPPNWRFLSASAIYASDVVLIPTKHNNIFSLENAAVAIKQYIPEVQKERNDGGPIALPIFFNGEKIPEAQKITAHKAIDTIIEQAKKEQENKFDLLPYFYPHYTEAKKDRHIFELPNYAQIANAAFSRIPAVYTHKTVKDYYLQLAKEYFL